MKRKIAMSNKVKELELKLRNLGAAKGSEKVDILISLAWEIGYADLQRAYKFNKEGRDLAEKISYDFGIAMADRNLGFYYYTQSDFESALKKSFEALCQFEKFEHKDEQANTLNIIGLTYWSLGNFDQALEYLHRAEKLFRETGNHERLPWTLTTLGGIHENLKDLDKALKYHNQSLKYFRSNGSKLGEARALSGIGTVYQSQKKYQEALECERKSLELFRELNNELGESRAYNDMGLVYQSMGNFDEALKYHQRSLEIRQKLRNKHVEITSLLNLGKLYNLMQDPDKALDVLRKALKYANDVDAKPKLYLVHQVLSEAFELKGDLVNALHHLKSYQNVKEIVFSDETNTRLKNMQIQFEVEKAEKEAEIHRLRNIELKQALDDLKETQVQLVQSEKMAVLGQLTAGIAHEINNPIGAVKSSADISIRGLEKIKQVFDTEESLPDLVNSTSFKKTLEILEKNSRTTIFAVERIAKIVDSLKNFSRLDEAEFKKADIHEGIESTLTLMQHEIRENIEIVKEFGAVPQITVYPNQLNQVFMTLLSNAIQAIEQKGTITIKTFADQDKVKIKILDTGKGMSPEILHSLFDLSFTTKSSRVGVGMGLYNAYNIIQKHRGEIKVESDVGKGTKFTIVLPSQ